jgi:hypothetical protein
MVQEANSPLIARMDADDICLPHRFEQQVRYLEQNPAISLVGCQIDCIDPQGNRLPKEHWANFSVDHGDIVTQLLFNCPFCHPSILFRTEAARQSGNYATPAPVEDLDLYLRLVQTVRVANLLSVGMQYRLHPNSICALASIEDRHRLLAIATVARHAEALFGIKSATYLQLRNQAHPLAILPLFKSALYRAQGNPRSFIRLVRTPTFLFISRCLTGKRDFVSKLLYRAIEAVTPSASTLKQKDAF